MREPLVLSCLFLCACGGSRGAPETDASSVAEGLYEYSANIPGYKPGSTLRVRGSMTVVGDSLFVQPDSGCVLYTPTTAAQRPLGAGMVTLNCGSASLNFDRRNLKSGRWFTYVQVPKQRNACVEYKVSEARRQVCVRYRPETYYENQQRSGAVQIRPM